MTYEQLTDEIASGKTQCVYLFTGPEDYLKQRAVEALEKALLTPGLEQMNESIMESPDLEQIIEACDTVPMMSKKRLVVVKDFSQLMPSNAKAAQSKSDRLIQWLERIPDTTCLVFYMRESADMRKSLSTAISKRGGVVLFDYLAENRLERWIDQVTSRRGVSIDRNAARRLIEQAGLGLTRLSGELNKLCDYAGKGSRVTAIMIDEMVTPTTEARVFQMIDCLMTGDVGKATGLVKSMLEAGETRVGILYMLTRQMRLMTHIKILKREGVPLPEIEKRLDVKSYPLKRMDAQSQRFSAEKLKKAYLECVDADFNIKSGRLREQAALDRIILLLGNAE